MDYLPEIDSDFSVYHRVDDFRTLPVALAMARIPRLAAYDGALLAALRRDQQGNKLATPTQSGSTQQQVPVQPTPVVQTNDDPQALWARWRQGHYGAKENGGHTEFETVTDSALLSQLKKEGQVAGG